MSAISQPRSLLRILTNMVFRSSPLWQQQTDSIYALDTNAPDPVPFSIWGTAWRLFRRRRHYDVVCTMGVRESMAYALLCRMAGVEPKQIMIEVFIDAPRPSHFLWRFKTRFYGHLARRAYGLLAFSRAEVQTIAARYGLPESRIHFVPLCGTCPPEDTQEDAPPFVLSAGRTLRDYPLLLRIADQLNVPLHVIAGQADLRSAACPGNVTVHHEVSRDVYLDDLRRCALVVLPLLPTERSTGQVVLLEAMALGKPVVATASPGTMDYVQDGVTGFLVPPDNATRLLARCRQLLRDADLRKRMGAAARDAVRERHMPDHFSEAALSAISALTAGFASSPDQTEWAAKTHSINSGTAGR